ncbi:epoxide hydrolase family protein [Kribbella sp. NPDC006257]|uniref:epoxide hydrolase family protein n=1 Tax=Kribbella sp. NPDC006257 TaxID=3156738 RepID=UPI0033AF25E4
MSIEAFRIEFPQPALDDLHDRLDRVRWPDELPGVGWSYGVPLGYLQELVHYWRHSYNWRAAEAKLNEWPQFVTTIDGARIHFAHLRSAEPDAIPLLISHGWPGSIAEFTELAGLLTSFHLVIPSIPGFGLSGPTRETGWEHKRVAAAYGVLMEELGYSRYGVQGGDWGAAIVREVGRIHPDRVIGVHLNLIPGAGATHEPTEDELAPLDLAERERTIASWQRFQGWAKDKQGYADVQSTRPQTLSYALTDSPVGQLAWIAEKFEEWSDGGIERDLLLTNVMLYWLTGTAGSSSRIYYERAHAPYWGQPDEPSPVPTAMADFPRDNFIPLRHLAEPATNIVRWTTFDRGGHFPAMEQPELLAGDITAFFASVSGAGG